MRTIRTKVYKFNELKDVSKVKVINEFLKQLSTTHHLWNKVYNDYEFYSDGTLYNGK